jgi:hypothetical protein
MCVNILSDLINGNISTKTNIDRNNKTYDKGANTNIVMS